MNENTQSTQLVVLDRDGVINRESDNYIRKAQEWIPIPGSLEAIARLDHSGYRVVVATNQSGLGRGYFSVDDINAIHRKMQQELSTFGTQVEAIFFCPHTPDANCRCRKPLPGLFEEIARRLQIDMTGVPAIGDSFRDIQAAIAVNASPSLVLTGRGQATLREHMDDLSGVSIYDDLFAAVDALLTD